MDNIRPRICRQCGAEFPGGPHAWYCPKCRRERELERKRKYNKYGPKRPLGNIDNCERCGKPYTIEGGKQKYCPDCAKEAVKEIDRQQGLEWYRKNAEGYNPERNERRRIKTKMCAICKKEFKSDGTPRNTCSEECRNEQRRRNQKRGDAKRRPGKDYVSVKEYAELHNVPVNNVWARITNNTLDSIKVGSRRLIKKDTPYGTTKKRNRKSFEESLAYLQKYIEENGDADFKKSYVCKDGFNLGNWYHNKKAQYKRGELTPEHVDAFESLGVSLDIKAPVPIEEGCKYAEAYYKEHGNLKVNFDYVCPDGFRFGSWIASKRVYYRNSKLKQEEIEALEKHGMIWNIQKSK